MTDGLKEVHRKAIIASLAADDRVERAVLFGSRATGTNTASSDVDIVLFGDRLTLTDQARLAATLDGLPMAQQVDLLLYNTIDSPVLLEAIERHGVEWYRSPRWTTATASPTTILNQQTLKDVADILMGQSPPGETCNRNGVGLPLLNGPTDFGPSHPSPTQSTTDAKRTSRVGDLLFCVRGSTTGRMNWAEQDYAIGRGIAAIRHRTNAKLQPLVRAAIECHLPTLLQSATGSTFPNLSAHHLNSVPFPVFSKGDAEHIAFTLGTLDDKVESNRRTNVTLEAMARAIFKDWFIDFGPTRAKMAGGKPYLSPEFWNLFPDRLDDEGKPERWEVVALGTAFDLLMGQSPPGDTYNDEGNGLPFFQGRTDFGFRFPIDRKYCHAPTRVANPGDTLVSVRAPVGDINMASNECCIGRGVAAVRHKSGAQSFTYYTALALQHALRQYEHTGTVFGAINKAQFEALPTINPGDTLVTIFEQVAATLDSKLGQNERDSVALARTRDLLLPKLMAGAMRLRDGDNAAEGFADG